MTFEQFERLSVLRKLRTGALERGHVFSKEEAAELTELERALKAHAEAAAPVADELHTRQVLEAKQRRERAEKVVDTAIGIVDFGLSLVGGILGRR